ncbi:SNF2 family N-terminal domain-containing protein [Mycena galericulata]|nr:SNF2 family N-terminal domain-containing protein [Mycena galericulata]
MEGLRSPFSIRNFLAYGTLAVSLRPDTLEQLHYELHAEDNPVAEDGWNNFDADVLRKFLESEKDDRLLREIEFLIGHRFIFASYLPWESSNSITLRIYMIPYDLPGVQGKLRVRKKNIVGTARRYLAALLPTLSRDAEFWGAEKLPEAPSPIPGTTLSGIYETLPSPQPLATSEAALTPISRRLLDFSDELNNLGLRTTLHKYQRRSVAAMVQKEMDLRDDPDPLFLPVVGLNKKEMYLQPGTMELLLERPQVAPCRGGILCEELGTGKTVMTLALILATLNQISKPEPSILETRTVLTPVAFRHFPSSDFGLARTRNRGKFYTNKPPRVPKLVELLLHQLAVRPLEFIPESRANHYAALWEDIKQLTHYTGPRNDNLPFYLDYQGEPKDNDRVAKHRATSRQDPLGPRRLYLTSATLVVVPTNLRLQWRQEVSRHCEGSLRVCYIEERSAIPPARALASNYDVVLMSYSRFTADANLEKNIPTWKGCKCPEYPQVRVPQCVCKPPPCSPLLQIRWKRLVIDEGHVAHSLTTNLAELSKRLSVERRWIVTGTPTTNLLGLNLGKSVNEAAAVASDAGDDQPSRAPSEGPNPDSSQVSAVADDLSVDDAVVEPPRVWNQDDGRDLIKLGNMIAEFVGVQHLTPKIMITHVKDALLDKQGPRTGAIEVLKQLMASVMIRHRIEEVEEEVELPLVTQEVVLLDLDPLSVKSYNALQAIIAINAVTSERKGQDYMFHAQNVESLKLTIQNMSQLMFWRVDDNCYNADEQLRESAEAVKSKIPASASPEDIKLLDDAIHHLEQAATDPLWRELQNHEDVPYRVHDLKRPVFESWTRTTHTVDVRDPSLAGYVHPDRLRGLRALVLAKPLISPDKLIELGEYTTVQDAERRKVYEESLKHKKGTKASRNELKAMQAAKKAAEPGAVQEMQKELEQVSREINMSMSLGQTQNPPRSYVDRQSTLVSSSCIAGTRVGSSASSKLNYIIQEVLKYSPKEKILIFSDSELSLAHISEALDLVGVDFLRFSTQIPARVREQFVMTFETSEKYRVFLMELKHGARGLNLISASRVIFCEPVWGADVESQAIKRCHRIGQKRPISVKTLAIRGTAEQTMAARRMDLKDSQDKLPKLIHEKGMRDFIANPKFLTHVPTNLPNIEVPLFKVAPPELDEDTSMADIESAEPMPSTPTPRRQVHFPEDSETLRVGKSPRLKRASPESPTRDGEPPKRRVRLLVTPSRAAQADSPRKNAKARVRFAPPR